MTTKQASDTDKQADEHRACIRECMAKKLFCESDKQENECKASNMQCMAKVQCNDNVKAADKRRAKKQVFYIRV